MKFFRNIRRYFRDAMKSVIRNFSLSLASISCIAITLIVVGISIVLSYNVENMTDSIKKDVTMVVFLKSDTTEDEVKDIQKKMWCSPARVRLGRWPEPSSVLQMSLLWQYAHPGRWG